MGVNNRSKEVSDQKRERPHLGIILVHKGEEGTKKDQVEIGMGGIFMVIGNFGIVKPSLSYLPAMMKMVAYKEAYIYIWDRRGEERRG